MRELYPDRQVKLLYRRDDAHLLRKTRSAGLDAALRAAAAPGRRGRPLRTGDAAAERRRLVG